MISTILLLTSLLTSPERLADEVRLKPAFVVTGDLYVDGVGTPLILATGKRLLLKLPGGEELWIQDINRLKGHVEIKSPDQALSYVRLWGSPLLAGAIGDSWAFEIANKSEADGLSFGNAWCKSALEKSYSGMYAIASTKTMHSERVRPATATAVDGGFEIRRDVLTVNFNLRRYRIFRMREFVKEDGEYSANIVSSRPASAVWLQGSPL